MSAKPCACDHDRATHYWDEKGSGDCLAAHCDCAGFMDREEVLKIQGKLWYPKQKKEKTL